MAPEFVVGIHLDNQHTSVAVSADDALVAAQAVKDKNPSAAITYVRKQNRRGDIRHPHNETD
ncbi:MAG TPA: hypothetical protein VFS01_11715 [Rhizomicrobium sp.]|jgi:hypothetical protein|nr:hypothetical protein [Rhizomicrobium sp.]